MVRQLRLLEAEPDGRPGPRLATEVRTALVEMMAAAIQAVFRSQGGRDEGGRPAPKDHLTASRPKGLVYLRQSSLKQVRDNLESQHLQYALADRARGLGFRNVEVIDSDLGCSAGLGAARRAGFDHVVAAVAKGEVGMILSREASRLSRNDRDWCHLLEVCQIFDTLIADEEQIYDLSLLDDQLILGIKGTLSVVELKVLKMRMLQGRESKAKRGELEFRLPPGYVWDSEVKAAVMDPDDRVRSAIALVFRIFREMWSLRQTFKWFQDQEVEVPVWGISKGNVGFVWKIPTLPWVVGVIKNPFYAGAYVYGRRAWSTVFVDGHLVKRAGRLRHAEESRVFLRDHHEGYISWEAFQENQAMIQRNVLRETDTAVAAVRSGHGLLAGLLRCGHCGRKLHVCYWGASGTNPRYFCDGDYQSGGSRCISFAGRGVDGRFCEELLAAISPLGLEASLRATEAFQEANAEHCNALVLQLRQLDYEVQRAFDQFNAVDARNRLVAAELERRWNTKLEAREELNGKIAELKAAEQSLSPSDEERIRWLGLHFAEVWYDPACPIETKKKIVHTLLEEIVVKLDQETKVVHFWIHWKGGVHTHFELLKPRSPFGKSTSVEALEIIRKMAPRYGDAQIASVLNRNGLRTGKDKPWNQTRVATARRNHGISGQPKDFCDPEILNLKQAALYCKVSQNTIQRLAEEGVLPMQQAAKLAPWEIRKADLDSEPVRGILQRLRRTGRLVFPGGHSVEQPTLFIENKGDDNARHYD
jgi:DNA invertase Pin-like site-specific DNA recombinase